MEVLIIPSKNRQIFYPTCKSLPFTMGRRLKLVGQFSDFGFALITPLVTLSCFEILDGFKATSFSFRALLSFAQQRSDRSQIWMLYSILKYFMSTLQESRKKDWKSSCT
jgi:hypothetical protein